MTWLMRTPEVLSAVEKNVPADEFGAAAGMLNVLSLLLRVSRSNMLFGCKE